MPAEDAVLAVVTKHVLCSTAAAVATAAVAAAMAVGQSRSKAVLCGCMSSTRLPPGHVCLTTSLPSELASYGEHAAAASGLLLLLQRSTCLGRRVGASPTVPAC